MHRTRINGTAYDIIKGKLRAGGTAYEVIGGKTRIGGTASQINFAKPPLEELLAAANVVRNSGVDSSTADYLYLEPNKSTLHNGTYYAFVFRGVNIGVHKIVKNSSGGGTGFTHTTISLTNPSYCNVSIPNSIRIYYSSTGGISDHPQLYGGTMALLTFDGYSEVQIDSVLQDVAYTNINGRSASARSIVTTAASNLLNKIVITATQEYIGFSKVIISDGEYTAVPLYGNNTTNPSLLWFSVSNVATLSVSGTGANNSVYGGSIFTAE